MDAVTYILAKNFTKKYVDEHSGGQAVLVATVQSGDSFPTTRSDGSALMLGDFVKPKSDAVMPFTISGITFISKNDQAVFAGGTEWLYNANPFQDTAETPVDDSTDESLSGTAKFQNAVNTEFKEAIEDRIKYTDLIVTDENGIITITYPSGLTNASGEGF